LGSGLGLARGALGQGIRKEALGWRFSLFFVRLLVYQSEVDNFYFERGRAKRAFEKGNRL